MANLSEFYSYRLIGKQMLVPTQYQQVCNTLLHYSLECPDNSDSTSVKSRPRTSEVLYFATVCTRRPSSSLLHILRSGTEKTLDSHVRRVRRWRMVLHPRTGQNLLMSGIDLLESPTGTVVAQRSEGGQGILGGKEGKGMWVWSDMVLVVLSSRMSSVEFSLTSRLDNVTCLTITTYPSCHGKPGQGRFFFPVNPLWK
jgi:hypothetical protein